jgi:tetratricopeptide (TPR) repeat protein
MHDPADDLQRHASQLLRQGRYKEAIDVHQRLLMVRPQHAGNWYNLGYLLKADGRYEQALQAYGKALALGIAHPEELHLNRAVIYADYLRRDAEAERELTAALTLSPEYAPALLNLGNLYEERGEREQAIQCYGRLLASSETAGADTLSLRQNALARMAHLQPPQNADDPMLLLLRQSAAVGSTDERANLLFSLGRAYNALGAYDPAFEAFRDANALLLQSDRRYNPEGMRGFVDALIEAFPQDAADQAAGGSEGIAPLFICGMFRSGSTLVEQVLAGHPQVIAGGELDYLPRLAAGALTPFPQSMAGWSGERQQADDYLAYIRRLYPQAVSATYVTDKRPDNFLFIGLIKRMFPDAKIIHTVRNPLDNGLSLFMQHLDPKVAAYASDLSDIGHYYGQYRRLMEHWEGLCGTSMLHFDYDAFVAEPEPQLTRLLDFLDLDQDSRCLQFHQLGNTVKTASYWQVRRPLYGEASGRWRHYDRHLQSLKQSLLDGGVDFS